MDPVTQTAPPGSTPVFQGAAHDAEILRAQLDRLFALAPEGSVIADPARRAKLATAVEHVATLTAELGAIQSTIPGRVGRVFGIMVSGLEKEPETNKVGAKKGTVGNLLPSPFGFLDPTAVGLPRNFYLPAGSTQFIPSAADRIGLGLREQRAEDTLRFQRSIENAATSRTRKIEATLSGESTGTLEDLAAGRGGFTRAGVLIATSGVDLAGLRDAAALELAVRANPTAQPPRAGLPAGAAAPVAAVQPAPVAAVQPVVGAGGGQDAATIRPVNDAGKRHEATAQGIARELVHERADP